MHFPPFPKITAGNARGDFLIKISLGLIRAQCLGNVPAFLSIAAMGRAQDLGTGKQLPAG